MYIVRTRGILSNLEGTWVCVKNRIIRFDLFSFSWNLMALVLVWFNLKNKWGFMRIKKFTENEASLSFFSATRVIHFLHIFLSSSNFFFIGSYINPSRWTLFSCQLISHIKIFKSLTVKRWQSHYQIWRRQSIIRFVNCWIFFFEWRG